MGILHHLLGSARERSYTIGNSPECQWKSLVLERRANHVLLVTASGHVKARHTSVVSSQSEKPSDKTRVPEYAMPSNVDAFQSSSDTS